MSHLPELVSQDRRRLLALCSAAGLGGSLFPGALLALAVNAQSASASSTEVVKPESPVEITAAMINSAATIAGVHISDDQKAAMLEGLNSQRDDVFEIRKLALSNEVSPAFVFDPVPGDMVLDTTKRPLRMSAAPDVRTLIRRMGASPEEAGNETLAFATMRELAELVKTRRVSATFLTRMYVNRLKRLDPKLLCVVTLLEERALKQAATADAEIAAGAYRGPLHGIPWGAKDLLAVKGYPTTWGAAGFEQQMFADDAEVVKRLDAAGAVLIAKLSMGALAQGDLWFGGRTRNPWNLKQGSSGSSAGSASAAAAGCVGFAIGTETLGSISSPSTRCGVTGLRPTFGFVPRTGAMALSWTMDKIGVLSRSVEDCALVLSVIHGPDRRDSSVKPATMNWDAEFDWRKLRVGYVKRSFEAPILPEMKTPTAGGDAEMQAFQKRVQEAKDANARAAYDSKYAKAALDVLRKMGIALLPVEMPKLPFASMIPLLEAEAAAAFDDLTRNGRDKLLNGQEPFDWPNQFRVARFYSAVDYIEANRARTLAIKAMDGLFKAVDILVTPSEGVQLVATNLTGQPAVIVPNGVRGVDAPRSPDEKDEAVDNEGGPGTPVSITFVGGLYSDARLAAFARAYQEMTGFHRVYPKL